MDMAHTTIKTCFHIEDDKMDHATRDAVLDMKVHARKLRAGGMAWHQVIGIIGDVFNEEDSAPV